MAVQAPTFAELPPGDGSIKRVTWTLAGTDSGAPIPFAQWSDRSVQFVGTWAGGTVVLEGSNDGVNYATLTDPQTTAISKTADGIETVIEVTAFVRPRATVSVTSVVVTMVVRRQSALRQ